ncbi:Transcriptional repressor CTCF-like [Mycena sanguinolenta]|uniref:Transcriptional repressor CTCF-like n=1 Tax=Mycena sanguinolenta TaxID=230812 RepID=A0A8H6YHY2_9AGAR|nr:Transcriptional repressor CTCF-like [Mycena sanguinolenta]
MPRVATTSTSRPLKQAEGGKVPPNPPLSLLCPQATCPWSFRTKADLKRHLPRHMSPEEREKRMHKCPHPGCTHKSLQKSNVDTHYITKHIALKPLACKQCPYRASDPSSLHRHMRSIHAYISGTAPRKTKSRAFSASAIEIPEPNIPASPASTSTDSWSAATSSSSSSSTYSDFPPSPVPIESASSLRPEELSVYNNPFAVNDALCAFTAFAPSTLSPFPAAEFSLPASSASSADFDPTAFLPCDATTFCVDFSAGIPSATVDANHPGTQYPAEGINFFSSGLDTDAGLCCEQQPESIFVSPPTYDYASVSCPLDSFSAFDLGLGTPIPFVGEWATEFC